MNNNFFYEHIGHMQFSTLTLQSLIIIEEMTKGKIGKFILWSEARQSIIDRGFTYKQADGELDRFCYGFECRDRYCDGQHELALTVVGRMFIDSLTIEANKQSSQIAILLRPARRQDHWNIIVQESTFWPQKMYDLVQKFNLRKGPARDFLKCLPMVSVLDFFSESAESLHVVPKEVSHTDLSNCLRIVETHGKYWGTVGGKYSWFVFPQYFEMPLKIGDWEKYQELVKILIRPPEWGGGKVIKPTVMRKLLGTERQQRFLKIGIVRPVYSSMEQLQYYQMTAHGYLMWERRCKGPVYELNLRRLSGNDYCLSLCAASDMPNHERQFSKQDNFPTWQFKGTKDELISKINILLSQNKKQLELSI